MSSSSVIRLSLAGPKYVATVHLLPSHRAKFWHKMSAKATAHLLAITFGHKISMTPG